MVRSKQLARLLLAVVSWTVRGDPLQGQARGLADRELGIGIVTYAATESYLVTDVIFASPSVQGDTVAILARDSLCFTRPRYCVRSYERMIEYAYEVSGWAIRRLGPDSTWAEVALAPSASSGPVGWVRLRPDSVVAVPWSQVLPAKPVFFLNASTAAFYRRPTRTAPVTLALARHQGGEQLDYIMYPLTVRGPWLQVRVVTPSDYCESPGTMRTDTLWIEYLTRSQRPRVFYHTRGC
jgi:hypothetical protein